MKTEIDKRTTQRNQDGLQIGDIFQAAAKALITDNNNYRKRKKPDFARFKAKWEYTDGNNRPMFSLDWNKDHNIPGRPIGKDNEQAGFLELKLWFLKCVEKGLIARGKIFLTFRPSKETSVMDYDLRVFSWDMSMGLPSFEKFVIPELEFDPVTNRVKLDKLYHLQKGGTNGL